jgi:hypothetical protein
MFSFRGKGAKVKAAKSASKSTQPESSEGVVQPNTAEEPLADGLEGTIPDVSVEDEVDPYPVAVEDAGPEPSDWSSGHHAGVLDRQSLLEAHAGALEALRASQPGFDDQTLLAFYRAASNEVKRGKESKVLAHAAARLQKTAAWRAEVKLDAWMSDAECLRAEREARKLLLYDYLGLDLVGRPVLIERGGAWDVGAIVREGEKDRQRFTLLHCMAVETLIRMARPAGCIDPRGQVLIMDCDGLSRRHVSRRLAKLFGAITKVDDAHFPDTLAHVFVVNAPGVFAAVGALVRPFLNRETANKVTLSSGVPAELVETTGAAVLPVQLGGTRERCFPYDVDAPMSEHPLPPMASPPAPAAFPPASGQQQHVDEEAATPPLTEPPAEPPSEPPAANLGAAAKGDTSVFKQAAPRMRNGGNPVGRPFVTHADWPRGLPPFISHVGR